MSADDSSDKLVLTEVGNEWDERSPESDEAQC